MVKNNKDKNKVRGYEPVLLEICTPFTNGQLGGETVGESSAMAVQGLVYTREAQALIISPETDQNEYSLDGEIPTGTNAGEYTVYIKNAAGDEIQTVNVSIAKADVIFTPPVPATTA